MVKVYLGTRDTVDCTWKQDRLPRRVPKKAKQLKIGGFPTNNPTVSVLMEKIRRFRLERNRATAFPASEKSSSFCGSTRLVTRGLGGLRPGLGEKKRRKHKNKFVPFLQSAKCRAAKTWWNLAVPYRGQGLGSSSKPKKTILSFLFTTDRRRFSLSLEAWKLGFLYTLPLVGLADYA